VANHRHELLPPSGHPMCEPPKGPTNFGRASEPSFSTESVAGSTGRRNTSLKFIRWSLKSQCLSRTLIQSWRDPI